MTVGVAALVVMALATSAPDQVLDPEDTGPTGARPSSRCCATTGSTSRSCRSIDELADAELGSGTTVVMANSAYVGHDSAVVMGDASAGADRLVLLSPTAAQLAALDLPLTSGALGAMVPVTAGCTSTVARRDDTAALVDVRLIPVERGSGTPATLCFALPDPRGDEQTAPDDFGFGAAMATVPAAADHPEVVALGVSSGFTNRWVDDESHAALAIRALGHSPRLLWYQPGIGDLANFDGGSTGTPWPEWLAPAAAVIGTAILVLAFVRGRRMGALVTEPLPVVVRAVETTESRGRIYRRARDRGRAAAILRLGSTERLPDASPCHPRQRRPSRPLRLPPPVCRRPRSRRCSPGRPPPPMSNCIALATALTDLEERVRHS